MSCRLATLAAVIASAIPGCAAPEPLEHLAAPNAVGPYSAAVGSGDLVFLAGKIGTQGLPFAEEVGSAIGSIEADLARLRLTLSDVVSVNVFLADIALFDELNTFYAARFPAPHPARAAVGVAALPKGARVELQAIARRR
jgi:2-iminobutanoate/2-iminopropanoate deaminase